MIVNFSVRNFKAINEEVTLSFEAAQSNELDKYYLMQPIKNKPLKLLKLGLIYGANASGKTTILEALNFLRDLVINPLDKKTDTLNLKPFLFDKKTPSENTFFSLEFIQNQTKYLYNIELNSKAVISESLYSHTPNKSLVYERETNTRQEVSIITWGAKYKSHLNKAQRDVLVANTLWNNTLLGGYLKTNINSQELQEVTNWFKQTLKAIITPRTNLLAYISNLLDSGKIQRTIIVELLKKADFNISGISIKKKSIHVKPHILDRLSNSGLIPDEEVSKIKESGEIETREVFFEHSVAASSKQENYFLPYNDESAGTQRYYQFAGLLSLLITQSVIFPVDELEASLHPDLFKHFLLTFLTNSSRSQLIATTHHREFFLEKDILRNDSIWFTEKNKNCGVDLFSLSDFDSSVIRNTSSIYNAYKIGKLGARPNLNDYFIDMEGFSD